MRLSPLAITVYAAVSLVGGFIALDATRAGWWAVIVVSAVTSVASVALLVLLGALVRRVRSSARLGAWLIPIAAFVGAGRAIVLVQIAAESDVPLIGSDVSVILNSTLSAVVWLTLVGLLVAGQDDYRHRFRELVRDSVLLDLDVDPGVQRMRSTISSAVAAAERDPSPEQWAQASQAIRSEIAGTLRPLSHRLWFGAAEEEPHARWTRVVRDAISSFTVPIRWLVLLWAGGALVGGIALFGVTRSIAATCLSTVVLLAVLLLGRRLVAVAGSGLAGWVALSLSALLPIVVTDMGMAWLGFDSEPSWATGLAPLLSLALAGMITLSAAVSLAASDRRAVLAVAGSTRTLSDERVSAYLHNSLQSELTGMAMQLEGAAQSQDPMLAREALERVQSLLSRSLSEDMAAFHEEPPSRAIRVAQAWAGICEVTFVIDPSVLSEPLLGAAVAAGEELISNAVRHTSATTADVSIDRARNGGLAVTCRADTPGSEPTGSGLGSALLRSMASTGVRVLDDGESTVYSLVVRASRRA